LFKTNHNLKQMTQFSTSWTPQTNVYDPPYFYFQPVNNVDQWQELEGSKNEKNFNTGLNVKKEKVNFTPNWTSVSSSESWGSGVSLDENNIPLKENVILETKEESKVEIKVETKENEENLTFQNNIRLPEVVQKGLNIEEELTKQNLYKTELCKSWIESGTCRYGDKCQFAHGPEELRPIFRHPKYKTEICKTFHNYGTCPYGKRCRFVHHSPSENSPPKEKRKSRKKKGSKENISKETETPKKKDLISKSKKNETTTQISETVQKTNEEENSENGTTKKNGSKLPFFQKLHKNQK